MQFISVCKAWLSTNLKNPDQWADQNVSASCDDRFQTLQNITLGKTGEFIRELGNTQQTIAEESTTQYIKVSHVCVWVIIMSKLHASNERKRNCALASGLEIVVCSYDGRSHLSGKIRALKLMNPEGEGLMRQKGLCDAFISSFFFILLNDWIDDDFPPPRFWRKRVIWIFMKIWKKMTVTLWKAAFTPL